MKVSAAAVTHCADTQKLPSVREGQGYRKSVLLHLHGLGPAVYSTLPPQHTVGKTLALLLFAAARLYRYLYFSSPLASAFV
eukprot:6186392-Pleurochrysis_carterae.AAC.3